MKIVNRYDFLQLPAGTLYAEYSHCLLGEPRIKQGSLDNGNDFVFTNLVDNVKANSTGDMQFILTGAEEDGSEFDLDFENTMRDGMFKYDQLYAIYSDKDIQGFVKALKALESHVPRKCVKSEEVPVDKS